MTVANYNKEWMSIVIFKEEMKMMINEKRKALTTSIRDAGRSFCGGISVQTQR